MFKWECSQPAEEESKAAKLLRTCQYLDKLGDAPGPLPYGCPTEQVKQDNARKAIWRQQHRCFPAGAAAFMPGGDGDPNKCEPIVDSHNEEVP